MRKAKIYNHGIYAGILTETDDGTYEFRYDPSYMNSHPPISLRLPLQTEPFVSNLLFPFFDGLIPEGWLLKIITKGWKLDPRDRMGILMVACEDTIGSVTVKSERG
jgi:serine/threonine-protein kinase HipA